MGTREERRDIMGVILNNELKSYDERLEWINKQIAQVGEENVSEYQREKIASYLIEGTAPETRGEIITPNRMVTVNKRETSREGLVEKLEGGESAFHQLIKQDRNVILTPKVEITEKDLEEVPGLRQLRNEINRLQERVDNGQDIPRKILGKMKQMVIEMRRDQYVLKNAFRQPIFSRGNGSNIEEMIHYDTMNLQDPEQVLALIMNYIGLKSEFGDNNESDVKWVLVDLDRLVKKTLTSRPSLEYILVWKIVGASNAEIREGLIEKFGIDHTQEYISSLYRNKIPQLIAETATEEWVENMFMNKLKGEYKKCSRCKQIKLASNRYFSINRTSSSNFYSVCKSCRNKKD